MITASVEFGMTCSRVPYFGGRAYDVVLTGFCRRLTMLLNVLLRCNLYTTKEGKLYGEP